MGIDAGISSLVTLSTGEEITSLEHSARVRARLLSVRLPRGKEESPTNGADARGRVVRIRARIADRRVTTCTRSLLTRPREPQGRLRRPLGWATCQVPQPCPRDQRASLAEVRSMLVRVPGAGGTSR